MSAMTRDEAVTAVLKTGADYANEFTRLTDWRLLDEERDTLLALGVTEEEIAAAILRHEAVTECSCQDCDTKRRLTAMGLNADGSLPSGMRISDDGRIVPIAEGTS